MLSAENFIIACIEANECPGGCDETYLLCEYSDQEGIYYPVIEINKIYYDDRKDYYVISGENGDIKYSLNMPILEAAIHYVVNCRMKYQHIEDE